MSYIGTNKIGKVYLGTTEIAKAYLGSSLVYDGSSSTEIHQVEYIVTNGTPYIDLGIKGNAATDSLYVDFQLTTVTAQMRLIAASDSAVCNIYINGSLKYGYRRGNAWAGVNTSTTVGTDRHTWLCDYYTQRNTVDGTVYLMQAKSSGTTTSNLLLGGPYGTNPRLTAKIYACKIYRSGTLILDLVPYRVGNKGCMYDTIGDTFYHNAAGTGTYTYGNDVD